MQDRTTAKSYGTVGADRQKDMSGLEFVQGLADGTLPLNTFARTLGYDVTEAASGRVVVVAEPGDMHLNPAGTVHGGVAATLLDSCMGLAVQSTLEKGVGQTTLEFKISLVRPITPETGAIRAEGVVLRRGRRVGYCRGPDYRWEGTAAGAWDDDVFDLCGVMGAARRKLGLCWRGYERLRRSKKFETQMPADARGTRRWHLGQPDDGAYDRLRLPMQRVGHGLRSRTGISAGSACICWHLR